MSNVALIGPFVCVYFYLLRFFNFWSLTVFIYVVLGYHIRGCNKVVYNLDARFERSPVRVPAVSLLCKDNNLRRIVRAYVPRLPGPGEDLHDIVFWFLETLLLSMNS